MPNLGFGELVLVLIIVMVLFGARRLPEIGDGVGKAIRNLKRGLTTNDDIDVTPDARSAKGPASLPRNPSNVDEASTVDQRDTSNRS